jgi:hypothetical protein
MTKKKEYVVMVTAVERAEHAADRAAGAACVAATTTDLDRDGSFRIFVSSIVSGDPLIVVRRSGRLIPNKPASNVWALWEVVE